MHVPGIALYPSLSTLLACAPVRPSVRWLCGLTLAMIAALPAAAAGAILVDEGATWRYLDNGSNQGTAWRTPGFNDGGWDTGSAELGYGDGDEATVVSFGGNSSNKHITTYFRRDFDVSNPSSITTLNLRIKRDDGAVVYLNGTEVYRTNMPGGGITYLTLAASTVSGSEEDTFQQTSLNPSVLVAGNNVVAVEVHQRRVTSSDLTFDLSLESSTGTVNASLVRDPYLQQGTPTSVVVRWRTDVVTESRVSYGLSSTNLSDTITEPGSRTDHEVEVTGLSPATTYFYSVGTTSGTLAGADQNHFFETAPLPGTQQPTRMWVIGDSGECSDSQQGCVDARAVRDAYLNFAGSNRADVWLLLGDNAYNSGTDSEYTTGFFEVYPSVMRNTVVWPSPGNHEFGASDSPSQSGPYYQAFTMPKNGEAGGVSSGTEAYYSFDYGNIHFIALDSHDTSRSVGGSMYNWLQADLANTDQDFIIAYWHHPPYTKGNHDSDNSGDSGGRMEDMRENFLPLLEDFGVDLQLTGHSHSYERSMLIDGHYGKSNTFGSQHMVDNGDGNPDSDGAYQKPTLGPEGHEGTVYTVVGSSSKNSGGLSNHPVMKVGINFEGSVVIDVTGNQLDGYFIDKNNSVRDHFRIVKGQNEPPVAVNDNYSTPQDTTLAEPAVTGVLANDSDPDSDPLTVNPTPISSPTNGTLTLNADGSFDYVPNSGYSGSDAFVYEVSDGQGGTDQASVTLTVTPVVGNSDPIAVNDSYSTPQDTPLSVPASTGVLANDSDPDGDPLTVNPTPISGPTNGTLTLNANGSFGYSPNSGFSGADSFVYEISDGQGGSAQATVTLTVTPVVGNGDPIAVNDSYSTPQDTLLNVPAATGVLANDSDPDGDALSVTPLSSSNLVSTITAASGASYVAVDSGVQVGAAIYIDRAYTFITVPPALQGATYIQTANDDKTRTDPAFLTFTLTEAATVYVGYDSRAVTQPGWLAPFSNTGLQFTYFDSNTTFDLYAQSFGPGVVTLGGNELSSNSSMYTVAVVGNSPPSSGPTNGTLTLNADGSFAYSPNSGFSGADAFVYEVSDGQGGSAQATVTLTVTPVVGNGDPIAVNDSYSTPQDTLLNVPAATGVLANDSDPDGDALSVTPLSSSNLVSTITAASGASYVAVDSGVQVGAAIYIDRAYTFITVPPALQGATYIQTANDDKTRTDPAFLTFTLTEAATVYVGYDSRAVTQPGWLAPFSNTGLQFTYFDSNTTFDLYAQSFGPGVVTLGGNELSSNSSMYTVAVVGNSPPSSGPTNGTLTLNADGSFAYSPNSGFSGADAFVYEVSDGQGGTDQATVTLTVNQGGSTSETVRDEFSTISYGNNDGTVNWANDWVENDALGQGAVDGQVAIDGGVLRLDDQPNTDTEPSAAREVNLTGATSATFSFDFATTSGVDSGDSVVVEVSNDGGATWSPLENFTGIIGATSGSRNFDIAGFIAANTRVRFRVNNLYGGSEEFFLVDNVEIAFIAPTGG